MSLICNDYSSGNVSVGVESRVCMTYLNIKKKQKWLFLSISLCLPASLSPLSLISYLYLLYAIIIVSVYIFIFYLDIGFFSASEKEYRKWVSTKCSQPRGGDVKQKGESRKPAGATQAFFKSLPWRLCPQVSASLGLLLLLFYSAECFLLLSVHRGKVT